METPNPSVGNEPGAASIGTPPHGPEETLAELTRCLSEAYTARVRIHLDHGEFDLAIADLNDAVRLNPENDEAIQLRSIIERPGQVHPALVTPGRSERDEAAIANGSPPQTHFRAGYLVSARYDTEDVGTDQPLVLIPLTAKGRLEAIEFAREMCVCVRRSPSLTHGASAQVESIPAISR